MEKLEKCKEENLFIPESVWECNTGLTNWKQTFCHAFTPWGSVNFRWWFKYVGEDRSIKVRADIQEKPLTE